MAIIKFSAAVGDASGKIGGIVFSRNSGGSYIREFSVPVNRRTEGQLLARQRMGALAQRFGDLSDAYRQGWVNYGRTVGRKNAFGDQIGISGMAAYIAGNSILDSFRQTPSLVRDAPPTVMEAGPSVGFGDGTKLVMTSTAGVVNYVVDSEMADEQYAVQGNNEVLLQVQFSRLLGPGVRSPAGQSFAGLDPLQPVAGATFGVFSVASPHTVSIAGGFGFATEVGQAFYVRIRSVTEDGRVGPVTYRRLVVQPEPSE